MQDTTHYKKILEDEKEKLAHELDQLGVRTTPSGDEWHAQVSKLDIQEADQNEAADRVEEAQIDQIVLDELEARYRLVEHALAKFSSDTYGVCEVSGEPIEEDRLHANPAARTCKAHMGEESTLTL